MGEGYSDHKWKNIRVNINSYVSHDSIEATLFHLMLRGILRMNEANPQSHSPLAQSKSHVVTLNLAVRTEDTGSLWVVDRVRENNRFSQGFTLISNLWLNLITRDVTIKEWKRYVIRLRIREVHFTFILLCMILNIFIAFILFTKGQGTSFCYESALKYIKT